MATTIAKHIKNMDNWTIRMWIRFKGHDNTVFNGKKPYLMNKMEVSFFAVHLLGGDMNAPYAGEFESQEFRSYIDSGAYKKVNRDSMKEIGGGAGISKEALHSLIKEGVAKGVDF